ncbi:diacylglycerol kinase family protein [Peribacillus sp. B-H-3]|jgi:undecaprenol kinase|uniref:diacylglycerol kinase family protein n=1 Tax=Peribacillus sp. B-H-3 TaxID=3400420 RepID=UPI003B018AA9
MRMAFPGKRKKRQPFYKSFLFAFEGIWAALKSERNMRIHFAAAAAVLCLGWYVALSKLEWMLILICIFGVISLELVNSAIERVVDLATSETHPLAKQAKDFAAGAVLVFAIFSVIIGLIIFLPKLVEW